jgi:site-specific recombinase XerD
LLHGDLGIRDRAIIETLYSTGNRRAELAGLKLRDTARNLNTFPDAGRIVPELGDETIRERFVYSYRLIYRIQGQRGADRCRRARLVR